MDPEAPSELLRRHDVEHGSERDIKKKQERLGQIFAELIGKPQPRMRGEFTIAQLTFLKRIEGMLRLIYEKIEEQATKAAAWLGRGEPCVKPRSQAPAWERLSSKLCFAA